MTHGTSAQDPNRLTIFGDAVRDLSELFASSDLEQHVALEGARKLTAERRAAQGAVEIAHEQREEIIEAVRAGEPVDPSAIQRSGESLQETIARRHELTATEHIQDNSARP